MRAVTSEVEQLPEGVASELVAVLELAVIVARTGLRAVPPIEPPASLKPFMRFTRRAPAPALRAARRVLDADAEFRVRVAGIATDELVGEVGVLYVERPEGWVDRISTLVGDGDHDGERHGEPGLGDDRRLERRLAGAESAAQRAEQALARARTELSVATTALKEERRLRAQASAEVERVSVVAAEREVAVRELRAAMVGESERAALADANLIALSARLSAVQSELDRRVDLDLAVTDAVGAVDRLAGLMHVLVARARVEPSGGGSRRPTRIPVRRPAELPRAVLDDTPDAAAHLLRFPGALVLIDGYNVAKWKWPDAKPSDLRDRLLVLVSQVAQRSPAEMHIVFDGAFDTSTRSRRAGAAKVRVTFTSGGVEADDVVIQLAGEAPPAQPVVVVTDDRRVREGVRLVGANVVPVAAFVAACGSPAR